MPSFQDSAIIVILALLLFGPKGMAKLARELGKLMGEFRRASADFRYQMEEEFRVSEQADQQKKIAAMEAAAPVPPVYQADMPEPEHPHVPRFEDATASRTDESTTTVPESAATNHIDRRLDPPSAASSAPSSAPSSAASSAESPADPAATALPIASSGNLDLMPPATGLPAPRSGRAASVGSIFDSIPHTPDPEVAAHAGALAEESQTHG